MFYQKNSQSHQNKLQITLVIGPTASGKSNWALNKAKNNQSAIINIDSAQVYKEIKICCGSPTLDEINTIPHYLFNYQSALDPFNIHIYLHDLYQILEQCQKKYNSVYIVGGSAMYTYCLLNGLHNTHSTSQTIKEKVQELYQLYGLHHLYDNLKQHNPSIDKYLDPYNTHRVLRTYEIFLQTGIVQINPQKYKIHGLKHYYPNLQIHKILPPKEVIYKKCQERVLELIKNGALLEAKNNSHLYHQMNNSAQKILLFNELNLFLDKKLSYDEMIQTTQKNTRKYAKKQYTWYNNKF